MISARRPGENELQGVCHYQPESLQFWRRCVQLCGHSGACDNDNGKLAERSISIHVELLIVAQEREGGER